MPTYHELELMPLFLLMDKVWPENWTIYKDGGRYLTYSDEDCQVVHTEQKEGEGFDYFMRRSIFKLLQEEEPDDEGMKMHLFNYAAAKYEASRKAYL